MSVDSAFTDGGMHLVEQQFSYNSMKFVSTFYAQVAVSWILISDGVGQLHVRAIDRLAK
jgi:hypothetical protein